MYCIVLGSWECSHSKWFSDGQKKKYVTRKSLKPVYLPDCVPFASHSKTIRSGEDTGITNGMLLFTKVYYYIVKHFPSSCYFNIKNMYAFDIFTFELFMHRILFVKACYDATLFLSVSKE